MINNTFLQRWQRVSEKHLDKQFTVEMIQGLQCSPFEAKAILDSVHKVYADHFDLTNDLAPGQIRFQVVSEDVSASTRLKDGKMKTVTLTLDAGAEDLEVRRIHGVIGLRRHRLERICHESYQQGGLLTLEDLAYRLFNCGMRTLCRDLEHFREHDRILPLRSTIKDMGRSITHRSLIVKEWLCGKEYSEISLSTRHSIPAIQNYISKFKRVAALSEEGFDVHTLSMLTKLSAEVVKDYHHLFKTFQMVPHRRQELEGYLKKTAPPLHMKIKR